MNPRLLALLGSAGLWVGSVPVFAEEKPADGPAPKPAEEEKGKKAEPKEQKSVTDGKVTIGGQEIEYTATAGTLSLTKPYGEPKASVFYIAYTRKNQPEAAKRPVMFCFNGGPGSSSVWLHLGAFGPRRVALPEGGVANPAPPFDLVPNEFSVLDSTDLVFIDPVSTGFSRAEKGEDAKQFHGYDGDLESVGDFIRRWVSKNDRWKSPKYVAGESYGGLRAAGLAGHLQNRYGMYLSGVVIVSGVVDFRTLSEDAGNDVPYLSFFPGYAGVAHYHKKLPPDLLQRDVGSVVREAEAWASGEYATALLKGNQLPDEDRRRIAQTLARYSGLPADIWDRARLRISPGLFRQRLLEGENKLVGRFDARAIVDSSSDEDPSYANVFGAYSGTLNAYVRSDLKFESDLNYEILTGDVRPWSYSRFTNQYVNSGPSLADALTNNPALRVYIACGWYDLATPLGGIHHTTAHLPMEPARARSAVTYGYYEGGHMMYTNLKSLEQLSKELHAFIK